LSWGCLFGASTSWSTRRTKLFPSAHNPRTPGGARSRATTLLTPLRQTWPARPGFHIWGKSGRRVAPLPKHLYYAERVAGSAAVPQSSKPHSIRQHMSIERCQDRPRRHPLSGPTRRVFDPCSHVRSFVDSVDWRTPTGEGHPWRSLWMRGLLALVRAAGPARLRGSKSRGQWTPRA